MGSEADMFSLLAENPNQRNLVEALHKIIAEALKS